MQPCVLYPIQPSKLQPRTVRIDRSLGLCTSQTCRTCTGLFFATWFRAEFHLISNNDGKHCTLPRISRYIFWYLLILYSMAASRAHSEFESIVLPNIYQWWVVLLFKALVCLAVRAVISIYINYKYHRNQGVLGLTASPLESFRFRELPARHERVLLSFRCQETCNCCANVTLGYYINRRNPLAFSHKSCHGLQRPKLASAPPRTSLASRASPTSTTRSGPGSPPPCLHGWRLQ